MFKFHFTSMLVLASLIAIAGCSRPSTEPDLTLRPSPEGEKLFLASSPANHQTVIQARETAKDGDEVAVLGRIGGSVSPWVDGRATFTIVDPTLTACSDKPGASCGTPWDYHQEADKLPASIATVKFLDDSGKDLEIDARSLLAVKELTSIVVTGKARRDGAGNLTVLASGVFVQPESGAK